MQQKHSLLKIRPATPENIAEVVKQANEDHHLVLSPTDIITRDDEIIGYLGLGSIPTMHGWLNTRKAKLRDSLTVLEFAEATVARNGHSLLFLPVPSKSPLFPFIERVGYIDAGYDRVFIKQL